MALKDAIRNVWAQIILGFFLGLTFSLVPETCKDADQSWICREVPDLLRLSLHHIGIGLIVASFVTCFWQIRELSEFFEKMAERTLIKHDYLSNLKRTTLVDIRRRADEAIMNSVIENRDYDRTSLVKSIDSLLYNHLMPEKSHLSGCYRKDYIERIIVKVMTLREILQEAELPETGISDEKLGVKYLRMTTETSYTVVMPILNNMHYRSFPISIESRSADLPFLPSHLQTKMWAGPSRDEAQEVQLDSSTSGGRGVEFKSSTTKALALPVIDGKCQVFCKTVEFKRTSESFVLNIMSHLTRGLRATLSVDDSIGFHLDGDVIGTGSANRNPIHKGIEITYDEWLFENNAYFIWWWEKSEETPPPRITP